MVVSTEIYVIVPLTSNVANYFKAMHGRRPILEYLNMSKSLSYDV